MSEPTDKDREVARAILDHTIISKAVFVIEAIAEAPAPSPSPRRIPMSDPHMAARHVLRLAGNEALTFASKIESTITAVHDLYGPAGVERLVEPCIPPSQWAAEKRAIAAELFASADALTPEKP